MEIVHSLIIFDGMLKFVEIITTNVLMYGKGLRTVANFERSHRKYFILGKTSFWEAKTSTASYETHLYTSSTVLHFFNNETIPAEVKFSPTWILELRQITDIIQTNVSDVSTMTIHLLSRTKVCVVGPWYPSYSWILCCGICLSFIMALNEQSIQCILDLNLFFWT